MFSNIKKYLRPVSLTKLAKESDILSRVRFCATAFYLAAPVVAFMFATNGLQNKLNFDPIWSFVWVTNWIYDVEDMVMTTKVLCILMAILAALYYRHRSVRILFFLALFQVHALESSYGYINHQWYTWLYTAGILVFLPDIWVRKVSRNSIRNSLLVLWTAYAMIFMTYFMAGVNKFVMVWLQWQAGEVHGLAMGAFLHQAAWWVPQLQQPAFMLGLVSEHPYWAWIFYVGLHFLQLFALWAVIRTSLFQVWIVLFIMFHIGTYLSMGISFTEHLLLLCAFGLASPFIWKQVTLKQQVMDLPVVGQLIELSVWLNNKYLKLKLSSFKF